MEENINFDEVTEQTVNEENTEVPAEITKDTLYPENVEENVETDTQQTQNNQYTEKEFGYVDFKNDPPEKIQRRFNRMYAQIKAQDENQQLWSKEYQKMSERLQQLEQDKINAERSAEEMRIKSELAEATAHGDSERVAELTADLVTHRTTQQQTQTQETEVVQQSPLTATDKQLATQWANEIDQNGNFVRPWIQKGHPMQSYAANIAQTIATHPDFADASLEEVLEQVDIVMATQFGSETNVQQTQQQTQTKPRPKVAAVSNTGDSFRPGTNNTGATSLSHEEKRMAVLLMPDIPPQEAFKRYAANKS